MSNIRRRGEKWQVRVTVGGDTATKSFSKEADALRWGMHQQVLMERGEYQKAQLGTTLADAIDRYSREVLPLRKGAKQEQYILNAWKASPLGKKMLADIKASDVALMIDRRLTEVSSGSVRRYLDSLSGVFSVAIRDWEIATVNPVQAIRKPANGRARERRMMLGELDRVIDAATASPDLPALIVLAVETGMRRAEMLGLEWKHINLTQRIAFLPTTKNGETRTVPLTKRAAETIANMVRRIDGKVFKKNGTSLSGAFQRAVRRARSIYEVERLAAGHTPADIANDDYLKNLRLHDCRHERISTLVEGGFNLIEAAAVSGHKTLGCLKRYSHVSPTHLVGKLDALAAVG